MKPVILREPVIAKSALGNDWTACWRGLTAGIQAMAELDERFPGWPRLGLVSPLLKQPADGNRTWRTLEIVAAAAAELGAKLRETVGDDLDDLHGILLLATSNGDPEVTTRLADARFCGEAPGEGVEGEFLGRKPFARQVEEASGLGIAAHTLSAACASANVATGLAGKLIMRGSYDYVIVLSFDLLSRIAYTGFARAGAMSRGIARPFDTARDGINIGEAVIGFVVVDAVGWPRPAESFAILGSGDCCDNGHLVEPRTEGVVRSICRALDDADTKADEVGAIYWHGTGTMHNDRVEGEAAASIFGSIAPPGTSTKSLVGHCMGASAAINILAALETLSSGRLPGIAGLTQPAFPVIGAAAETRDVPIPSCVVVNALGFGGINSTLVLGRS